MEIYILTSLHPGIPLTRDPIHNSAMTLFLNLEKEGVGRWQCVHSEMGTQLDFDPWSMALGKRSSILSCRQYRYDA